VVFITEIGLESRTYTMERWCEDNIEGDWSYCRKYYKLDGGFWFEDVTDAMAFKLKFT
jgi:hypothetical protein